MATLPPLVDDNALAKWLADKLPGGAVAVTSRRIGQGHSNETFLIRRGNDEYVLRRPPRGPLLPTAHDVKREWRVISALYGSELPVPQPVLLCEDESVLGAPFYLMSNVQGYVIRDALPSVFNNDHSHYEVGRQMVETLARLHKLDYQKLGLGDLGKPDGYLARQVKRWTGQLDGARTRPVPDLDWTGEWLRQHLPDSPPSSIVHGDYRLDNLMFGQNAPPQVVAVLDWEMATLGDPLADLGYLFSYWVEPGEDKLPIGIFMSNITVQPGFMGRKEAAELYSQLTGTPVKNLAYYIVLAIWKLAVLLEGSYKRHLSGTTDDPFFATLDKGVPALAARARELAEQS